MNKIVLLNQKLYKRKRYKLYEFVREKKQINPFSNYKDKLSRIATYKQTSQQKQPTRLVAHAILFLLFYYSICLNIVRDVVYCCTNNKYTLNAYMVWFQK